MNKLMLLGICLALCSCECYIRERIDFEFHGVNGLAEDERVLEPKRDEPKTINLNLTKSE